jgi:N-acetylneuraminic acid mutarotase
MTATTYSATSGVALKGPLILGTTVTAQELTSSLAPNGKQYSYQTNSDLGTFSPNSTFTSQYIGVAASGYYFDEVTNAVSTGPVTLNGYNDLTASSIVNVNLLTTLAYQRIQTLVSSGLTFSSARSQAESEVLTALGIPPLTDPAPFNTLDFTKGTEGDKILAAVSSMFVYGNNAGNLSALIAAFQSDIASDGTIDTPATRSTLQASARALNPADVAAHLTQKYASLGVTFQSSDISEWLDQDGDGLVGKFEYRVDEAGPGTVFTLPTAVTDSFAGDSVSALNGDFSVNGTFSDGQPKNIAAGDALAVTPIGGWFPNGVRTVYLVAGTKKLVRVSFISGLASIAVTPASYSLPAGLTQQFTATGTYTDGSIADLTASVSWASSEPAVATVDANSGRTTAASLGWTSISASSGSIQGSTTLHVVAPVLMSISLSPNPTVVVLGHASKVSATGTYSDGTVADITSLATWATSSGVATVAGGVVSGVSLGSALLTAGRDSISGNANVTVATSAWVPAASLATARTGHTATLLPDGRVLVAGGMGGSGAVTALASVEIYDPAADRWTPAASMAAPRGSPTATLLPNGKVLLAGGSYAAPPGDTAELYDPASDSWASAGSMSAALVDHTATLLGSGKVLVVGRSLDSAETARLYDPALNSWSAAAGLTHARSEHRAVQLQGGKVLIVGGDVAGLPAEARPEIFDPSTASWADAATMAYGRWGHTATLMPDGRVLVAGGAGLGPSLAYKWVEIFDPAANAWTLVASMSLYKYGHTATLLPTGTVLVTGGRFSADPSYTTTEIYDGAADEWSPSAPMGRGRSGHTATLLNNGKVLVTGGTLDGDPDATAELFDYAENPN